MDYSSIAKARATMKPSAGATEARRQLRAQQAIQPHLALPPQSQGQTQAPVLQMRNTAGQFGIAAGSQAPGVQQDTVPAMLTPGERVLTPQENQAFQQMPQAPQVLGVDGQNPYQDIARQRMALAGQALHFASGGVVPTTTQPGTPPPDWATLQAQTHANVAAGRAAATQAPGSPSAPTSTPAPPTTPIEPTTPTAPTPAPQPVNWADLASQINAFGPNPATNDALYAQKRAQESQHLANIERARNAELGAAAASSGALLGGDVKGLSAQIAQQRLQSEAEVGTNLAIEQSRAQGADYSQKLGIAGQIAGQRESIAAQTAENEALRKFNHGEKLSDQEFAAAQRAMDRQYGTSERVATQSFTAEEAGKQRTFAGDQASQDRLTQIALAEKSIEAQRVSLQTQIAEAQRSQNSAQAQQLTLQLNDITQQQASLHQQNDQFLSTIGLDRQRFEEAGRQFDLTRGDQVGQFAQSLEQRQTEFNQTFQQHATEFLADFSGDFTMPDGSKVTGLNARQLAQTLDIANMNDQTTRYVAEMRDRLERFQIDQATPSELASAVKIATDLASLGQTLGVGGSALASLGRALGFGGGPSDAERAAMSGGQNVALGGAGAAGFGALGLGAAGVGIAALTGALGQGPQDAAQIVSAGILAPFVALKKLGVFGPGREREHQDAITKALDDSLKGATGTTGVPPPDNAWWKPESRAQVAQALSDGAMGNHISDPDWKRLESLGLAAGVHTADGQWRGWVLIDDPKLLAQVPPGGVASFTVPAGTSDRVTNDNQKLASHFTDKGWAIWNPPAGAAA